MLAMTTSGHVRHTRVAYGETIIDFDSNPSPAVMDVDAIPAGMAVDDDRHYIAVDAMDVSQNVSHSYASTSQTILPGSPHPPCDVCGTRRLCIGCITQNVHGGNATRLTQEALASLESQEEPKTNLLPISHSSVTNDIPAVATSVSTGRSSMDRSSDVGSSGEWREEQRCLWGDGTCSHRYNLPRDHGESSLVTVMRRHLEECHPEIFVKDSDDKYICRWDGCQVPFSSVTSVARHILTGKRHLEFGLPCPDCHEGRFRRDSLRVHRNTQICKARKR